MLQKKVVGKNVIQASGHVQNLNQVDFKCDFLK